MRFGSINGDSGSFELGDVALGRWDSLDVACSRPSSCWRRAFASWSSPVSERASPALDNGVFCPIERHTEIDVRLRVHDARECGRIVGKHLIAPQALQHSWSQDFSARPVLRQRKLSVPGSSSGRDLFELHSLTNSSPHNATLSSAFRSFQIEQSWVSKCLEAGSPVLLQRASSAASTRMDAHSPRD